MTENIGVSAQGATYVWNGMEVTLLDAWHYYKQDVVILRLEVHNPTSRGHLPFRKPNRALHRQRQV